MLSKELMWDAFMTMVDLGRISVIVEDVLPTIDGGEILTGVGDVTDVISAFAENEL